MSVFELSTEVEDSLCQPDSDPAVIYDLFKTLYMHHVYPGFDTYKAILLCAALERDRLDVVEYLLDKRANRGFSVNHKYGYVSPTPLNIAVRKQMYELIEVLVKDHGASVQLEGSMALYEGSQVLSAIEGALVQDDLKMFLILAPYYSHYKQHHQRTLLHLAALQGADKCTRYLLKHESIDINAVDKDDGYTALMLGVRHGVSYIQMLLDHSAGLTGVTKRTRRTVLHLLICRSKHKYLNSRYLKSSFIESMKILLANGVDVHATDIGGDTALTLLLARIFGTVQTKSHIPPLCKHIMHGQILLESLRILLCYGSALNDHLTRRPLLVCVEQMLLVLKCYTSDRVTVDKETRIGCILQTLSLIRKVVKVLLRNGASPNMAELCGCPCPSYLDFFCSALTLWTSGINSHNYCIEHIENIKSELMKIFLYGLHYGARATQPNTFVNLIEIAGHLDGFHCFLVAFLNTLDHGSYTRLVHKALKALADQRHIPPMNLAEITAMRYSCRSLKVLCRTAVYKAMNRMANDLETIPVPSQIKGYIKALHL